MDKFDDEITFKKVLRTMWDILYFMFHNMIHVLTKRYRVYLEYKTSKPLR